MILEVGGRTIHQRLTIPSVEPGPQMLMPWTLFWKRWQGTSNARSHSGMLGDDGSQPDRAGTQREEVRTMDEPSCDQLTGNRQAYSVFMAYLVMGCDSSFVRGLPGFFWRELLELAEVDRHGV